jgi:hypothetical protein
MYTNLFERPVSIIEEIFMLSALLLTLFVSPYVVDFNYGTCYALGVWQWWRMAEGESPCCEAC